VLELDYCCGQQCMLACKVTAKGLATSAGLQARYRSAAGITAAEALSRVGNFLAVGLPHRIDDYTTTRIRIVAVQCHTKWHL
jgi:hypothetical protein